MRCLPRNAKPVTTWTNIEEAFLDVSRGIQTIAEDVSIEEQKKQIFSTRSQRERERVLYRIDDIWIKGVLERLFTVLDTKTSEHQEQVDVSLSQLSLAIQEGNGQIHPLPPDTDISQVYDKAAGRLLILGGTGAGKTTSMLQLAHALLKLAKADKRQGIPLIFNLSSWVQRQGSLDTWFVKELKRAYQVPPQIGRYWIESKQVIPLVDGLDEIDLPSRSPCIKAINLYLQENKQAPMVVCGRSSYLAETIGITIPYKVFLSPLLRQQGEEYGIYEDVQATSDRDRNEYREGKQLALVAGVNSSDESSVTVLKCAEADAVAVATQLAPVEVFCSYSHEDAAWLHKLETHLSLLQRQGLISLWHDRRISPGINWAQTIDRRLEAASVILLLVSADFVASDYCYGIEMKRALERHEAGSAWVLPILVHSVDRKHAPFAHLPVLPTDVTPIASWVDTNTAFADVTAGIRRVIVEDLPQLSASTPHTTLPKIWNVPYPRNPFFLGRDAQIAHLRVQLQARQTIAFAQPQAISGLGGIGKTQLALEYAYRYHQDYQVVLWARAESTEALVSSYVAIATHLMLPEQEAKEQDITVQAVKIWLQTHHDWLFILDNVEELALVPTFLPSNLGGHVLLTTRATATEQFAHRLEIETLCPEQGALFLLRRAALIEPFVELSWASREKRELAMRISEELGGLPLALEHAGAYLEETGTDLTSYWQIYQQHRANLLRERRELVVDHPESVVITWSLSFRRVEERNPAAAELLCVCAFLSPDAIPEEILTVGASSLGPVLASVAGDAFQLNQAIETLRAYSLVQRDLKGRSLSSHRLVQDVIQDAQKKAQRDTWAERAMLAVNAAFPDVEHGTWRQCERVLLQALTATRFIEREQIRHPQAARLLHQIGFYLKERARYQEVLPLLQCAQAIYESIDYRTQSGIRPSSVSGIQGEKQRHVIPPGGQKQERQGNRELDKPEKDSLAIRLSANLGIVQKSKMKADVLLTTVTPVETEAVLELFPGYEKVYIGKNNYYDLGQINDLQIVLVQRPYAGSSGSEGSYNSFKKAIEIYSPLCVIMVGIAFGIDSRKQNIGDILVSQYVRGYEPQRVSSEPNKKLVLEPCGERVMASTLLLGRFRAAQYSLSNIWPSKPPKVDFGLIFSGSRLVDQEDYRNELRSLAPDAIGGEMEGIGLYHVASDKKVHWIVVKGVCDWADGNKYVEKDDQQRLAARNAAMFTHYMLQRGGIDHHYTKKETIDK
jgi:nucleoside phosphorylase